MILGVSIVVNSDIVIYTDGGCSGNPGPGGWGIVSPLYIPPFTPKLALSINSMFLH